MFDVSSTIIFFEENNNYTHVAEVLFVSLDSASVCKFLFFLKETSVCKLITNVVDTRYCLKKIRHKIYNIIFLLCAKNEDILFFLYYMCQERRMIC